MQAILARLEDHREAARLELENIRNKATELASDIGFDLLRLDLSVPLVVAGVTDGRAFYLRERHDLYDVVMSRDPSFSGDLWLADAELPTVVVRSGSSDDLLSDGHLDPLKTVCLAVSSVRDAVIRESCTHRTARRFCADCGIKTQSADN